MIAYLLALTFTPCPRPIDAPPIRLTIINTQTPDEALGHEARHALQRWRHAPFLTNSEGVCE